MKPRILKALLKKEVTLMRHNPLIPRIIIAMPIMVMLVLPLVANLDVKNVNVAVVDNDRSQLSRRMIADIDASEYLNAGITKVIIRDDKDNYREINVSEWIENDESIIGEFGY